MKSIFLLLLTGVFLTNTSAQKRSAIYKSVYQVNSPGLSIPIPDTVFKQIGVDQKQISIPAGQLYYENYYQKGLARTNLIFVPSVGLTVHDLKPAAFFSRTNDNGFFLYEGDSLVESYYYTLPKLVPGSQQKNINHYPCDAYYYNDSSGTNAIVWVSRKLPFEVNPGVCYKNLGGIVRIDYFQKEVNWSIELLSFEKTNQPVDFKKDLSKPGPKKSMHFIFRKGS